MVDQNSQGTALIAYDLIVLNNEWLLDLLNQHEDVFTKLITQTLAHLAIEQGDVVQVADNQMTLLKLSQSLLIIHIYDLVHLLDLV